MKFFRLFLAASLLCSFIACNHNKEGEKDKALMVLLEKQKSPIPDDKEYKVAADSGVQAGNSSITVNNNVTPNKVDWDKKIIKVAKLLVELKDFKPYNASLRVVVKQLGGYIACEEQSQSDYKIENIVSIRVPVDQFENAVTSLTPATEKILEKKISSDDVTSQIVDTKSRMEAKRKVRDRYIDMLKQAKNMEEILKVQNEINDKQEEIESAAGRAEYLGHASAYSTINLTYYQVLNPTANNVSEPSYGAKLLDALKSGLSWFATLFLGLASLWPLSLLVALVIVLIKKFRPFGAKPQK